MGSSTPPFHLAFAVVDIASTRRFYGELLGCTVGRESEAWIDFDFFGHQITGHVIADAQHSDPTNPVDGDRVPIPHFGAVLEWEEWQALAGRLEGELEFLIGPRIRFQGEVGEQGTFFVRDPSGNALEFKSFKNPERLFAS